MVHVHKAADVFEFEFRTTNLQNSILVLNIQKMVFPCMRWPLRWRGLGGSCSRHATMGSTCFLVGQDVGKTGKDRFRGKGEGICALFDGMKNMEDFGMPETLQLTHRATQDLRNSFLALGFVKFLSATLLKEEDWTFLKKKREY